MILHTFGVQVSVKVCLYGLLLLALRGRHASKQARLWKHKPAQAFDPILGCGYGCKE